MLSFAIILAFVSFIFEMLIASKFPIWRKLAYSSKLANLALSLLLSYILGIAFGAAGLTVMTAALLSTLMSIPGYNYLAWNYDTPKAKSLPEKSRYKHEEIKVKKLSGDLYLMAKGTAKIITSPVWIPRDYIYNPSKKIYNKFKS
jgi:hypothetical protein